jgi:hypothetical protein
VVAGVLVTLKSFDEIRSSHHPHKQNSKTDPEGEGTTEVWELLTQQHDITLQNTAVATNIALGVFYWKSQYLNLNWYYSNQRGEISGRNIQIILLIALSSYLCHKICGWKYTYMLIYSSFQKFLA